MSDFNFRKPLSNNKKTLSEALAHINKVYNSNFSPVSPDKVDMTLEEATVKTIGNITFEPFKYSNIKGNMKAYIIKNKKGEEIGYIKMGKSVYTTTIPYQLFLGKDSSNRRLELNLYPDSTQISQPVYGAEIAKYPKNKALDVAAKWIEKNHKDLVEEVVGEAKEELKVVKKDKPSGKGNKKATSEFAGDKRGFNRFVEEEEVEEIEEIEEDSNLSDAYAPLDTPNLIGAFTEVSKKKRFEYRKSTDKWGMSHGLPHEVCVSSQGLDDWRAANVKGTVCYIATDEGEGGKPVLEKWAIRNHVKYVKAESVEEAFIRQNQWAQMRSKWKTGTPVHIELKDGGKVSGTMLRMDKYDLGSYEQGHMVWVKTASGKQKVMDVDVKSIEWNNDPKTKMSESIEEETTTTEAYGNPFTPRVPGTFAAPNFKGFSVGQKVKVPHKGKMVTGKIVRYDDGGTDKARQSGGGYVVDVGEPASILVPAHKVVKEEVEQIEELTDFQKNTLNIARKTVKYADAILGVMGGMTKKQAHEFLLRYGTTAEKTAAAKYLGRKESLGVQMAEEENQQIEEASQTTNDILNAIEKAYKKGGLRGVIKGDEQVSDTTVLKVLQDMKPLFGYDMDYAVKRIKKFLKPQDYSKYVKESVEQIEEAYYSKAGAMPLFVPAKFVYDDFFAKIRESGMMFNRLKAESALEYIFGLMHNPRSPYSKYQGMDILHASALEHYRKIMGLREEVIEEGVRSMAGAEKMIKDDPAGGSSLASSFRNIKKSLEGKPTGSVLVSMKLKSPESMELKIYSPNDFKELAKGLSKKPEAKVGSKGSWSDGEVTVLAIKESVEIQDEGMNEAYIASDAIKVIRDDLKKEFPKFKFMVARERNSYSSLRVAIVSGPVAFVYKHDGKTPAPHADLNVYYPMNYKNGEILKKILATINKKNWDRSDIQTDYFDVGFYVSLTQGNRSYGMQERPYTITGVSAKKPTSAETQKKVNAIISKVVNNVNTKNAVTGKTHTKSPAANAGGPGASRYGVFEDKEEVNEKSPPSGPARKFSKDPQVKADFKKKYGERWKEVMYATAWKMHNK